MDSKTYLLYPELPKEEGPQIWGMHILVGLAGIILS